MSAEAAQLPRIDFSGVDPSAPVQLSRVGTMTMSAEVAQLPRIDFSGVDPSAPGAGTWSAVRAQVVDALDKSTRANQNFCNTPVSIFIVA